MELFFENRSLKFSLQERKVGNCRIVFRWEGKQITVTTSYRKEKDVPKKEALALVKAEILRLSELQKQVAIPPTSFKLAMEHHLKDAHSSQDGKRLRQVERSLEKLGEALGWPEVQNITKESFRAVIPVLAASKSPKTWRNEGGEMRHFSRWLVDEDMILRDFTRGVKFPGREEFGTHEQIYKEEWFEKIRGLLPSEWQPVWEDFWYTGLDTKDLFEIRPKLHLIESSGAWKIWKTRSKEGTLIDQPLSSKIRQRWIKRREACGESDPLHPNTSQFKSEETWGNHLLRLVHDAQEKLGLPKLDLKTTRHTFATRHVLRLVRGEKNAPSLDQIRRWLGHAPDSRMLERIYAKLSSLPELMD